jgi:hypothetical protein
MSGWKRLAHVRSSLVTLGQERSGCQDIKC